jgi:shikimate kinase
VRRHLILIGLPGAGKSTVGKLLGSRLGVPFVDLDELIEGEQHATVREIFATRGEQVFRELEREAAQRLIRGPSIVIAPGGGWAAQPGALEEARQRCFIVYLRAMPETAAARVGGTRTRPLLAGADPAERLRELLAAREPFYVTAEVTVSTEDRSADAVADEVAKLARSQAGW